ncbi:hypothetical protein N7508_006026 [Penicillium antarcticum]|uniref:uncharacterized protein n=1 Tax=Penicillium antarcticum TaxID=416450 RepID=UPI0023A74263|nr:uncharacterized protein N7508_006026 [Penicillium antarcticum]KAJ5307011.1 hypothetical protein N7508_006026 [Penicillium antarcticum]
MHVSTIGLMAITAGVATAKTCLDMIVQVPVTAHNGVFDKISTPQTNLDATAFALHASTQGANVTADALSGYATVSGIYDISAQYCMPDNSGDSAHVLQILTHGMGFDKSYWDLPYENHNYSYVDHALSRGYHTLAYDRLGLGKSSHGDAKSEIQSFLELEALAQLTRMVREGSMSDSCIKQPSKIVHVGHSFGSAQTYGLTAKYPDLSDGIILTGFSMNASFMGMFISGANFVQARFNKHQESDYSAGYFTSGDITNNMYLYFAPGHFDMDILTYAEATKQPSTIGELLTVASMAPENNFGGPVYIINGDKDIPFCGGDCFATGGAAASIAAAAEPVFPSASCFSAYIQPNTGHGINLHHNATGAYQQIHNFLEAHGL